MVLVNTRSLYPLLAPAGGEEARWELGRVGVGRGPGTRPLFDGVSACHPRATPRSGLMVDRGCVGHAVCLLPSGRGPVRIIPVCGDSHGNDMHPCPITSVGDNLARASPACRGGALLTACPWPGPPSRGPPPTSCAPSTRTPSCRCPTSPPSGRPRPRTRFRPGRRASPPAPP